MKKYISFDELYIYIYTYMCVYILIASSKGPKPTLVSTLKVCQPELCSFSGVIQPSSVIQYVITSYPESIERGATV